jgi:xylitol oxidase
MLPSFSADAANEKLSNWSGNLTYGTDRLTEAASVDHVRSFVRSRQKFKALGTRHCFNSIADSHDEFLSLKLMQEMLVVGTQNRMVAVGPGITYGQLAPFLDSKGLALHNLASLPHISVAGAVTTATHGSGEGNGNLSTAVAKIEMVTGNGDVAKLSRATDSDVFRGAVVGLGALGVITRVLLDVQPTYQVRQYVYEGQLPTGLYPGAVHGFLYANGVMSDMTDLGVPDYYEIYAYSINAAGQIVGDAYDLREASWRYSAFLYTR